MKNFKKILISSIVIIVIIFLIQNGLVQTDNIYNKTTIKFILWEIQLPIIIILTITYILGIASYLIISIPNKRKLNRELSELKKENEKLNNEINNLRNMPLED